MDEKTKAEQLETADESAKTDQENDLDVLVPEPEIVKLGDREYKINPLKLKDMRLLVRLSKVNTGAGMSEDDLTCMVEAIGQVLKEDDLEFVEANLDLPTMQEIFVQVERVNRAGIPQGGNSKKGK